MRILFPERHPCHPGSDVLRREQARQLCELELALQESALAALKQSGAAAHSTEALYARSFLQSAAACYALDAGSRIVQASETGAALLGQAVPGTLLGQPFERYLAPESQPDWRRLAASLQGGAGRAGMEARLFDGLAGSGAVRLEARLEPASGLCCVVLASRGPEGGGCQPADAARLVARQAVASTAALLRRQAALRAEMAQRAQARPGRPWPLGERQAGAIEREREALARALHEQTGQDLLALRMDIAMQAARGTHAGVAAQAARAMADIDAALASVRAAVVALRPTVLDLGLPAAIDWQLARFRRHSGIACTLDMPDDSVLDALAPATGLMLFRQLQAALDSIRCDAGASAVQVSLHRSGGGVLLAIGDDGSGDGSDDGNRAPALRRRRQANAVLAIGTRLHDHGGTLEVEYGGAGRGCVMRMHVPSRA